MLNRVDVRQSVLEATWTDGAMVGAAKRATTNSKSLVRAPVVGSAKVMATTKENVPNQGKGPRKMMQAQANMELHKGANQVVANLVVANKCQANQVVANLVVANKCQGNQVVANKCLANQEVGNLDLQEAVVVVEVVVVVSAVVVEELDVVVMAVVMVSALVMVLALAVVMDKRKFVIEERVDT